MAIRWTQTHYDTVQQAMLDLAGGKEQVQFSIDTGGGSRSFTYAKANMPQLQALLNMIEANLERQAARAAKRTMFFGVVS